MWRTDEPAAPAAARRFIVPMTLISCMARLGTEEEFVIMKVWRIVSTWVALTIRFMMEYVWSARTNSARSKGTDGVPVPMPRITLMLGSVSRAWIIRPPQNVSAPVTRTRRLTAALAEPDAAPIAQHLVHGLLEERADL